MLVIQYVEWSLFSRVRMANSVIDETIILF